MWSRNGPVPSRAFSNVIHIFLKWHRHFVNHIGKNTDYIKSQKKRGGGKGEKNSLIMFFQGIGL